MPPKFLEPNFDTSTVALSKDMGRDSTNAFVSLLNDVVQNYDFTKVDTDAATNLVNATAKKLSEQGWQQAEKAVQIEDGWTYFIHGWTQVIAEVFDIEVATSGPQFDAISRIAAEATGRTS